MNSLIKPNYAYQDEQGRLRDIFRKTFGNEHRIRVTQPLYPKSSFITFASKNQRSIQIEN